MLWGMSDVLAGALSLLLSTNKGAALTNLVAEQTGVVATVPSTNDPVAVEFQALLKADDEATDEVQHWLDALPGGAEVSTELKGRIDARYGGITRTYEDFIRRNPRHAPAVIAYGSFLGETGDELGMADQWEKAREMDPSNPAVWNNLAGHYAHRGPIEKAFPYFEKAIELNPREAQYWHALGTVTYLFRRDAEKYYGTDEQGVFRKAFEFYDRAMALRPLDFKLAADVAQTWYGVKPAPAAVEESRKSAELALVESGLRAWTNAFRLAADDAAREGVRLHYARWQIRSGRWNEARTNLDLVLDPSLEPMKARLERNWREKQNPKAEPKP
jgi:tetratricopeptide (TPR) repeat protein